MAPAIGRPGLRFARALLLSLSGFTLAACSLGVPRLPTQAPASTPVARQSVARSDDDTTPRAGSVVAQPTPAPKAPEPLPPPPEQPTWAHARVDAVSRLYNITPRGRALLLSLDVRQMKGEPGWFGSFGYHGWAGLGEAKPVQVIHELSHTIWGGYPVEGQPDLSWDPSPDGGVSSAMQAYHDAVLEFMRQPPDAYEPLRQRFRDLPGLSEKNLEPLYHTAEADMVYTVGGSLDLVPPVLRPYWSYLLLGNGAWPPSKSPLTWDRALAWYMSLDPADRLYADRWIGFAHFDMEPYRDLPAESAEVDEGAKHIIDGEDEQRLRDFASQFDLLTAPGEDKPEDFGFWRGYVSELMDLHTRQPEVLRSAAAPWGPRLADAFDFLADARRRAPDEAARLVAQRAALDVTVAYLVPAIPNEVLVVLFSRYADELPREASSRGAAAFAATLRRMGPIADRVLAAPLNQTAAALKDALLALGLRHDRLVTDPRVRQEINLLMDLLLQSDRDRASAAIRGLPEHTRLFLYATASGQVHFTLTPGQLLSTLGIRDATPLPEMGDRMRMLVDYPVGNYRIDRPYYDEAMAMIARRALGDSTHQADPVGAMDTLRRSNLPLDRFIQRQPQVAAAMFARDTSATADLFLGVDQMRTPAPRLVHELAQSSPVVAARVTARFVATGRGDAARESIAAFAYDGPRTRRYPSQRVSLKATKAYLGTLSAEQGPGWLSAQIDALLSRYDEGNRDAPAGFRRSFLQTLTDVGYANVQSESRPDA